MKEDFKSYEFQDLKKNESINQDSVKSYEFQALAEVSEMDSQSELGFDDFKNLNKSNKDFKVAPVVKAYKKINRYLDIYKEKRINDEIEKKLLKLEKKAFEKGYNDGFRQGEEKSYAEKTKETEEKIGVLSNFVEEVLKTKKELLENEKHCVYELIKSLVKWIILRELKDDDKYIFRILEKLAVDMENKNNVLIQIDKREFEKNKDIFQDMKNVLKKIPNVEFDVSQDIENKGIILITENEIVDGTLERQFENLDKIFSQIDLKKEVVDIIESD